MFGRTKEWGLLRTCTASFTAPLPTGVPGISFASNGRIRLRRTAVGAEAAIPAAVARAAALSAVYHLASGITGEQSPDAAFDAEQQIAMSLGDWQASDDGYIEFKGSLQVSLAPTDAVRAKQFDEARRNAHLEEVAIRDRLDFLRKVVLCDASAARLWWLHRNLEGNQPETSWEVFDEIVRPLITNAIPNDDDVTRFAKLVSSLVGRIHEEPDRFDTLAVFAATILRSMGWADLADEAANLINNYQTVSEGGSPLPRDRSNGSAGSERKTG